MVLSIKELTEQVLKLPFEERVELSDRLLASLSGPERDEMDKLLVAEILRRRDEIRSGAVKGIDGEQVLAEVRRRVGR